MNTLLIEILNAREARAARQQSLLQEFRCPVICFTMNIAGPVKTSPLIRRAFDAGLAALEDALSQYTVNSRELLHEITGDEAIFSVDAEAPVLKAVCTAIEEGSPMGRLFDMDVLDLGGRKLERSRERCCLVCGKPGRSCAARRLHSVEQLQEATRALISSHFADEDATRISNAAVDALLEEVHTTPKPGLVDQRNNGSHEDMDQLVGIQSIKELRESGYKKVSLTAKTTIPRDFWGLPGIANYTESPDKTSVSFMYNGNITAIIDKLHLLHLDDVLLEEPSLEEIFMHYYA